MPNLIPLIWHDGDLTTVKASKKNTLQINFNPNHDDKGKFDFGSGSSTIYDGTQKFGGPDNASNGVDIHGNIINNDEFENANKIELTSTEISTVRNYTNTSYMEINDQLRGINTGNLKDYSPQIDTISSAINKGSLSNDVILYRGIAQSPDDLNQLKVDDVINDKAFVSATYNKNVAYSFAASRSNESDIAKTVAVMKIPKGTKGLVINKNIDNKSIESEILLSKNSSFKITAIKKAAAPLETKSRAAVTEIRMELIK